MPVMLTFGEKLRILRLEKGWTQPEFAELLEIEQSYLSKLENGKSIPSEDIFTNLMNVLVVPTERLLIDVDREYIQQHFSHIPAIVEKIQSFDKAVSTYKKRWLLGAMILMLIGFSLLLSGNMHLIFPSVAYNYHCMKSDNYGCDLEPLADNIYPFYYKVHGDSYQADLVRGQRTFTLYKKQTVSRPENRLFMCVGIWLLLLGSLAIILEKRLHSLPLLKSTKPRIVL